LHREEREQNEMTVSEQLREAIRRYGSVYAVARDSEIVQPVLNRFVSGERDLRLATVDRLCEFFGMHLTRPKRGKDQSPYKRKR
jgi:DNA-binding phage protein